MGTWEQGTPNLKSKPQRPPQFLRCQSQCCPTWSKHRLQAVNMRCQAVAQHATWAIQVLTLESLGVTTVYSNFGDRYCSAPSSNQQSAPGGGSRGTHSLIGYPGYRLAGHWERSSPCWHKTLGMLKFDQPVCCCCCCCCSLLVLQC